MRMENKTECDRSTLFEHFLELRDLIVDLGMLVQRVGLGFRLQLFQARLDVVDLAREVFLAHGPRERMEG